MYAFRETNFFYAIVPVSKKEMYFTSDETILTNGCLGFDTGKSMTTFGVRRVVYTCSSKYCGVTDEVGMLNAVLTTHPVERNAR